MASSREYALNCATTPGRRPAHRPFKHLSPATFLQDCISVHWNSGQVSNWLNVFGCGLKSGGDTLKGHATSTLMTYPSECHCGLQPAATNTTR
jgi:hypothetical protein